VPPRFSPRGLLPVSRALHSWAFPLGAPVPSLPAPCRRCASLVRFPLPAARWVSPSLPSLRSGALLPLRPRSARPPFLRPVPAPAASPAAPVRRPRALSGPLLPPVGASCPLVPPRPARAACPRAAPFCGGLGPRPCTSRPRWPLLGSRVAPVGSAPRFGSLPLGSWFPCFPLGPPLRPACPGFFFGPCPWSAPPGPALALGGPPPLAFRLARFCASAPGARRPAGPPAAGARRGRCFGCPGSVACRPLALFLLRPGGRSWQLAACCPGFRPAWWLAARALGAPGFFLSRVAAAWLLASWGFCSGWRSAPLRRWLRLPVRLCLGGGAVCLVRPPGGRPSRPCARRWLVVGPSLPAVPRWSPPSSLCGGRFVRPLAAARLAPRAVAGPLFRSVVAAFPPPPPHCRAARPAALAPLALARPPAPAAAVGPEGFAGGLLGFARPCLPRVPAAPVVFPPSWPAAPRWLPPCAVFLALAPVVVLGCGLLASPPPLPSCPPLACPHFRGFAAAFGLRRLAAALLSFSASCSLSLGLRWPWVARPPRRASWAGCPPIARRSVASPLSLWRAARCPLRGCPCRLVSLWGPLLLAPPGPGRVAGFVCFRRLGGLRPSPPPPGCSRAGRALLPLAAIPPVPARLRSSLVPSPAWAALAAWLAGAALPPGSCSRSRFRCPCARVCAVLLPTLRPCSLSPAGAPAGFLAGFSGPCGRPWPAVSFLCRRLVLSLVAWWGLPCWSPSPARFPGFSSLPWCGGSRRCWGSLCWDCSGLPLPRGPAPAGVGARSVPAALAPLAPVAAFAWPPALPPPGACCAVGLAAPPAVPLPWPAAAPLASLRPGRALLLAGPRPPAARLLRSCALSAAWLPPLRGVVLVAARRAPLLAPWPLRPSFWWPLPPRLPPAGRLSFPPCVGARSCCCSLDPGPPSATLLVPRRPAVAAFPGFRPPRRGLAASLPPGFLPAGPRPVSIPWGGFHWALGLAGLALVLWPLARQWPGPAGGPCALARFPLPPPPAPCAGCHALPPRSPHHALAPAGACFAAPGLAIPRRPRLAWRARRGPWRPGRAPAGSQAGLGGPCWWGSPGAPRCVPASRVYLALAGRLALLDSRGAARCPWPGPASCCAGSGRSGAPFPLTPCCSQPPPGAPVRSRRRACIHRRALPRAACSRLPGALRRLPRSPSAAVLLLAPAAAPLAPALGPRSGVWPSPRTLGPCARLLPPTPRAPGPLRGFGACRTSRSVRSCRRRPLALGRDLCRCGYARVLPARRPAGSAGPRRGCRWRLPRLCARPVSGRLAPARPRRSGPSPLRTRGSAALAGPLSSATSGLGCRPSRRCFRVLVPWPLSGGRCPAVPPALRAVAGAAPVCRFPAGCSPASP